MKINRRSFSEEESDRSARLSVLEGNLSTISGGGDVGNSRQPYPVPPQRLVEEAIKHREAPKRDTHHTWMQLVLSSCWRSNFWAWHVHLLCSERSLDQPCKPYADLIQHQQPERASWLILGISQPNTTTRQWGRQSARHCLSWVQRWYNCYTRPAILCSARGHGSNDWEQDSVIQRAWTYMVYVCVSPRWRQASINEW